MTSGSFIEGAAPPRQRDRVAAIIEEARGRVAAFYGFLKAEPRILVCVTSDCYRRINAGGSRGNAFLDLALQLAPDGVDPVIAAHELSHIELHYRLGRLAYLRGAVPAWFDEGLAVVVSGDRRYFGLQGGVDRCLVRSDEPLPAGILEWSRETGRDDPRQLYAKAACRVAEWLLRRGGAPAVLRLIGRVANGTPFAEAYAAE